MSVGLENRNSILPTPEIPSGPGIMGPDYSFADNIALPHEIGVRDGDTIQSVTDSVKAVGYYVDTIGFGQPTSALTRGMDIKPLGVRFWMPTGFTCSNGAKMWQYTDSIPKGDALGQRIKNGLNSIGYGLQGLAPGIVEDAKDALDPKPLMEAVFGSGYPQCRFEVKPIGDQNGRPTNPASGKSYVQNPESIQMINGVAHQGRWVFEKSLLPNQWKNAPKTHCPDGFRPGNHEGNDCNRRLISTQQEGFESKSQGKQTKQFLLATGVIGVLLYLKHST
jgi:hypothetical protein